MAKEYYVKITIEDLSLGTYIVPIPTNFTIVTVVDSPSGPYKLNYVPDVNTFTSVYLNSSNLNPTDNVTVLHTAKLLQSTGVYVIRASKASVLEGITCKGEPLLFDTEYNLLSSYNSLTFPVWEDSLKYYYLAITDTAYYTGDITDIDATVKAQYATWIQVSTIKSVTVLVSQLYKYITGNVNLLEYSSTTLVLDTPVTVSKNLEDQTTSIEVPGNYSILSSVTGTKIKEADYVQFRGTTYYYGGTGAIDVSGYSNPYSITFPNLSPEADTGLFMYRMLAQIESASNSYEPFPSTFSKCALKLMTGGETPTQAVFEITPDLEYILALDTDKNLLIYTTKTVINKGVITVNNGTNKYLIVIGTPASYPVGTPIKVIKGGITPIQLFNTLISIFVGLDADVGNTLFAGYTLSTVGAMSSYIPRKVPVSTGNKNQSNITGIINLVKNNSEVTYSYIFPTDKDMTSLISKSSGYVMLEKNLFYIGNLPPPVVADNFIKLSDGPLTYNQFIEAFYQSVKLYYDAAVYYNSFVFTEGFSITSSDIDIEFIEIKQQTDAQFAIVQQFISGRDNFGFSYVKADRTDGKLEYKLTLQYRNFLSDYDISFEDGVVDGNGVSLYYTNVDNPYLKVIKLTGTNTPDQLDAYRFGSGVEYMEASSNDFITAVQSLLNYENGLQYNIIWDAGFVNPGYAKAIIGVCSKLFSMFPQSFPTTYTTTSPIISYDKACSLNSKFARKLFAPFRDSSLGQFSVILNGSLLMLQKYIDLFGTGTAEFVGTYGLQYGLVDANFITSFDKTDRELLLDNNIATVAGGEGIPYYINSPFTGQNIKSDYSFDYNVRLTIVMAHIIDKIGKQMIGQPHSPVTMNLFKTKVEEEIRAKCITNKLYAPEKITVQCDDNNNELTKPLNILRLDLWVTFAKGVGDVHAYIKNVPLESNNQL